MEEVESIRGGLRGLVVGKVLTCTDHPDSDHLHITTVDLGAGAGADSLRRANVAAGQTVIVATIGTKLWMGDKEITIKKSKMRGVESMGMICAEDEIGIGESHDGIMVLPDGVKPGIPAAEYFNVESDYCLEVELTPNRVDAASHYRVARDLKALFTREQCLGDSVGGTPEINVPDASAFRPDRNDGQTPVEVIDRQGYPPIQRNHHQGNRSQGISRMAAQPAHGRRPTSHQQRGGHHQLHPARTRTAAPLLRPRQSVRRQNRGAYMSRRDEVHHARRHRTHAERLRPDDMRRREANVHSRVFGGMDSGVTESTTDVFIESAYFNPTRVRRTARRHGLSTDASFRYERGTDPDITVFAAKLAAVLIKELAGGEICGDVSDSYPEPVEPAEMDFSLDYCDRLIGKKLPKELITAILAALEISVEPTADGRILHLKVPTYRVDVYRPCDVVEEIASRLRLQQRGVRNRDARQPFAERRDGLLIRHAADRKRDAHRRGIQRDNEQLSHRGSVLSGRGPVCRKRMRASLNPLSNELLHHAPHAPVRRSGVNLPQHKPQTRRPELLRIRQHLSLRPVEGTV